LSNGNAVLVLRAVEHVLAEVRRIEFPKALLGDPQQPPDDRGRILDVLEAFRRRGAEPHRCKRGFDDVGGAYDAKQDLVRIPMTVTSNNAVVEKMEIMVKPAGKGGEIVIAWDTYKAVAGFTAK
jgi:hypothetical protein